MDLDFRAVVVCPGSASDVAEPPRNSAAVIEGHLNLEVAVSCYDIESDPPGAARGKLRHAITLAADCDGYRVNRLAGRILDRDYVPGPLPRPSERQ